MTDRETVETACGVFVYNLATRLGVDIRCFKVSHCGQRYGHVTWYTSRWQTHELGYYAVRVTDQNEVIVSAWYESSGFLNLASSISENRAQS